MSHPAPEPRPRRKPGIIEEALDSEVLLYDRRQHRAHSLNPTSTRIWRALDGQASVSEIAGSLAGPDGERVDPAVVWLALRQLEAAELLEERLPRTAGVSRRDALKQVRLAAGLALALPAMVSIVAPTPAEAASGCLPGGSPCGQSSQCCSNSCVAELCGPENP